MLFLFIPFTWSLDSTSEKPLNINMLEVGKQGWSNEFLSFPRQIQVSAEVSKEKVPHPRDGLILKNPSQPKAFCDCQGSTLSSLKLPCLLHLASFERRNRSLPESRGLKRSFVRELHCNDAHLNIKAGVCALMSCCSVGTWLFDNEDVVSRLPHTNGCWQVITKFSFLMKDYPAG